MLATQHLPVSSPLFPHKQNDLPNRSAPARVLNTCSEFWKGTFFTRNDGRFRTADWSSHVNFFKQYSHKGIFQNGIIQNGIFENRISHGCFRREVIRMKRWNQIPGEYRAYLIIGALILEGVMLFVRHIQVTDQSDANLAFGVSLAILAALYGLLSATIGGVECLRTIFARK